jgi:chemotaxis protein methyltransferase CheR
MSFALKHSQYEWNDLVKDVSDVISKITGNVMAEKQYPMVESRLKKRCLDLRLEKPSDYKDYWLKNKEAENNHLVGLLTTHFTSFFREFSHFEWLGGELPSMVANAKREGRRTLKFWSAASSKGQEVWSLCMWIHHHMAKIDPSMDWIVVGSDIDPVSVREGENGVYHRRELETAPLYLWQAHWVKGKGEIADWYKIKADLRKRAKFQTMNLLSLTIPKEEKFDAILCRNVLIYFDRDNQEKIVRSLLKHLTSDGALITGMSESLNGLGLGVKGVAPSIYKSQEAKVIPLPSTKTTSASHTIPYPLKVLCVDDSSTIIAILKKILQGPEYEIIGVAKDGLEALEKLKTLKPDVITLDLHMPNMDGPTFLKESGVASKTPVIVVSSVGREHSQLISPLMAMGVTDFVEKPSLENIAKISEELKQKLKMGWIAKSSSPKTTVNHYVTEKRQRASGLITFSFDASDSDKVMQVLAQQKWEKDELKFVFNGSELELEKVRKQFEPRISWAKLTSFVCASKFTPSYLPLIWLQFKGGDTFLVKRSLKKEDFFYIEDAQYSDSYLRERANDITPCTSFAYLVDKSLGG